MGNIGKATEPCISTTSDNQPNTEVTDIFLAVPSSLTSGMIRIQNLYRFMYIQHVYDLEKRRGDCLMKWLIMLGFMDLKGPRVCWRSTPVLFPRIIVSPFNSLWPSDVIWWLRTGSTLAQVMACCLTAPSHYLNQCWLIINGIVWQSPKTFNRNGSRYLFVKWVLKIHL